MTAQKKGQSSETSQPGSPGEPSGSNRKSWVKKTPTELILQQVTKQEERVNALRKELATAEADLKKMQDATRLLSAK